ncbi:MAG TPA: helix-turn-helix domain-containing protein [Kribbella sp.]
MDDFGAQVRDGRERLGLDQAELAQRVGVGQQTVSRWERGKTRPKPAVIRALAACLEVQADGLLAAAGYGSVDEDQRSQVRPAVRPQAAVLPFHELSPERFEEACAELMQHLHPNGHASRYGGSGERQDGIDILVDEAEVATGQCKRHKVFGPKDVELAVAAVKSPAPKNYLFLSRKTATAAARAAMRRHEGWELWDGEDLSRYVRSRMTLDESLRFVDSHFPNHREPFLGVPQPGPWMTLDQFYASMSGDQLFTHRWQLAGRASQLAALRSAVHGPGAAVAVLLGRGGIGKTRLLRALAETLEDTWVRLLPPQVVPDAKAFELIPSSGDVVIMVDDAHERLDVGLIVARAQARNPAARIVLASRPYGRAILDNELGRAGYSLSDVPVVEIGDLSQSEAEQLAREALGPAHTLFVERLAALTRDCPLATTVGGHLLRTGELGPRELEQDDRFRDKVLRGFREAVAAESLSADPELRRAVVDAVSVLQPFRSGNAEFQEVISALTGAPYHRVSHHLRSLEDAGLLIRRGDSLRIVPDLLGDVVLSDACIDRRSGIDTGYLTHVLATASGEALANAFVNVSRVDWQAGHVLAESTGPFWQAVQQDLDKREIATHVQIIKLLGRIAPFQPARTTEVLQWIVDHPIEDEAVSAETPYFQWKWSHVLDEIPPVLRSAAYSAESLPAVCSLLWELAQTDHRQLNQYPNHPLRVLRELAEYSPYKPIIYHTTILDLAEGWVLERSRISPLQVIDVLVATEGESHTFKDHTMYFGSYPLPQGVVSPIRRRAIGLALNEIRSGDPRRGVAGARLVHSALRTPPGAYGRRVERAEEESWDADFVQTMDDLRSILSTGGLDPVVCVAALEAVHWLSVNGTVTTKAVALAVIDSLPDSPEFDAALVLRDGWMHLIRRPGTWFEEHEQAIAERLDAVASRLLAELDDSAVVRLLEERIGNAANAGQGISGGMNLLNVLVQKRPSVAVTALARVTEVPESALAAWTADLVRLVSRWSPNDLVDVARTLLEHPSGEHRIQAAIGLARRDRQDTGMFEGELSLLQGFAASRSEIVRSAVLQAAFALAASDVRSGAELLARIRIGDSQKLADDLCMYLEWSGADLTWAALSQQEQDKIFAELRRVADIGSPSIGEFLRNRSAEAPDLVVSLLRQRVEDAERDGIPKRFHPMPYAWHRPLELRQHSGFLALLRELLEWLGHGISWQRRHYGPEVFAAAAGSFDDSVLSLLLETVRSGAEASVSGVIHALSAAPNDLIYGHVSFVSEILDAAAGNSTACLEAIRSSLFRSAVTGSRWGTPGEPFPEDVRLRDECAAIAAELPKGSYAAQFYLDLSRSGALAVEHEIAEDRSDGRAW